MAMRMQSLCPCAIMARKNKSKSETPRFCGRFCTTIRNTRVEMRSWPWGCKVYVPVQLWQERTNQKVKHQDSAGVFAQRNRSWTCIKTCNACGGLPTWEEVGEQGRDFLEHLFIKTCIEFGGPTMFFFLNDLNHERSVYPLHFVVWTHVGMGDTGHSKMAL